MKSLNDSLRDEFAEILNNSEIKDIVNGRKLDLNIVNRAFEKLLLNKYGSDENFLIEKGRAEFETYIINTLKTKTH